MRSIFILAIVIALVSAQTYIIGPQGKSCSDACHMKGLNCDARIVTNNSPAIFQQLGVTCTPDYRAWWAENQPGVVVDKNDPNFGKCLGFNNTPTAVFCGSSHPAVERLCACSDPNAASRVAAFGTGYAGGSVDVTEMTIFNHIVPQNTTGVMTHFWMTSSQATANGTIIRYYVDDEPKASIEFFPYLAAGVGFNDAKAPWGTQWFGKGAADAAYHVNFRIPFQRSIRITTQHTTSHQDGFYIIVRGAPNLPINIGGIAVPSHAKLKLIKTEAVFQPVQWVPLVDIPTGSGLFFMHTLAVTSGNENFLEGCYHQYTPYNQSFPGVVLSTGTEDYFDSAWYFNAGQFALPVSGFTHFNKTASGVEWSGYRFHEMDPLPFTDGFRFMWRNGDMLDASGLKCYVEDTNGRMAGFPTASYVIAYAWVYVW